MSALDRVSRARLVNPSHFIRTTMRNLWRTIACLLIGLGCLSAAQGQIVYKDGVTDQGYSGMRFWVDANGDGKDDYCIFTGGSGENMDCFMSGGSTFSAVTRFTNVGTGKVWGSALWGDVNGDGYQDMCRGPDDLANNKGAQTITCYLGPTFTQSRSLLIPVAAASRSPELVGGVHGWDKMFLTDVNGDGRADICYIWAQNADNSVRCRISTDTGFAAEQPAWISAVIDRGMDGGWARGFYDFNGDGTPDFCRALGDNTVSCLLIKPSGFTTIDVKSPAYGNPAGPSGSAFVDVNGDGNIDYCRAMSDSSLGCVLSNGKTWDVTQYQYGQLDLGDSAARFWTDINGDGFPDFCRLVSSGSAMSCRLGKGVAPNSPNILVGNDFVIPFNSSDEAGSTDGGRQFCDPNGTGISTYCRPVNRKTVAGQTCWTNDYGIKNCSNYYANSWSLIAGLVDVTSKPVQAVQPVMTMFSDGMGAETHITYLPMSSTDVYTHAPVAIAWPQSRANVQPAGRVPMVYESRVWRSSDQAPLSGTARYFFKDARSDWQIGSLGFRERWIFTEASNSLDHIIAFQGLGPSVDASSILNDWREVGQVKFQEHFLVADGLIPTPDNTTGLSNRQAKLNAIGAAARSLPNVVIGSPTSSSPFILVKSTTNTLADTSPANAGYRFVGVSAVRSWDWTGSSVLELPATDTTTAIDDIGNVSSIVARTLQTDGSVWRRVTTTNTYGQDDRPHWLLGRLTRTSVKTEAASDNDQLNLYPRSAGRLPNATATSSSVPAAPQPASMAMVLNIITTLLLSD